MTAIRSAAEPVRGVRVACFVLLSMLVFTGGRAAAVERVIVHALFKDRAVVIVDGQRHLLKAGDRTDSGVRLVRADSDQAVLEIDGHERVYTLGAAVGGGYSPPDSSVAQIWPDSTGMYTTVGSINGLPVRFLVDTGASAVAMNAHEARRLGIDFRLAGEPGRVSTASGVVPAFRVSLDRVQVGDVRIHNVAALVLEGDHPDRVLLGMSFLGRLQIERQGRAMLLRKTH